MTDEKESPHMADSQLEDSKAVESPTGESSIESLKAELEAEREKANTYLTQLKYLKADFENYQKRTRKEISEIIEFANERLILRLLTQLDDLERAVNSAETAEKTVLVNGLKLILTELKRTLVEEGLQEISTEGEPFDPSKHEASAVIHSDKYPDQTIVEELRKGYMLKGRVLRPSIVKVARRRAQKIEEKLNPPKSENNG